MLKLSSKQKSFSRAYQQAHLLALSEPKKDFSRRELPVVQSTFRGKISNRILFLSRPKQRSSYNEIYDRFSKHLEQNQPKHAVNYSRIYELSKPIKSRKIHDRCRNAEPINDVYFNPKKAKINSDYHIKRRQWLEKNAKPKKKFYSPIPPKSRKLPREYVNAMCFRLSQVAEHKKFVKKPELQTIKPRPPRSQKPKNMDWVNRLSQPRKIPSDTILDMNYDPYFIPKKVLKYKPTERILKLSKPRVYDEISKESLKPSPFTVNKSALKYKASKRIIELSQPRKR